MENILVQMFFFPNLIDVPLVWFLPDLILKWYSYPEMDITKTFVGEE